MMERKIIANQNIESIIYLIKFIIRFISFNVLHNTPFIVTSSITSTLLNLTKLWSIAHIAGAATSPIDISTSVKNVVDETLKNGIAMSTIIVHETKNSITYLLHCQSSALNRPLLFSAAAFPISVHCFFFCELSSRSKIRQKHIVNYLK